MALMCICEKGNCHFLRDLPKYKDYSKLLARLTEEETCQIFNYFSDAFNQVSQFSVATAFGEDWRQTPLMLIHKVAGGDETKAAISLGILVLTYLFKVDSRKWACIKTNLNGRDLATNFYWLRSA